ncbi:MAG: hypothetical protein A07HR60_00108 [uncultured archaeon A07HR60]|nr:MAG: hypothetical protein A07HR60_00108 [uncultured archaeon A07HR60]
MQRTDEKDPDVDELLDEVPETDGSTDDTQATSPDSDFDSQPSEADSTDQQRRVGVNGRVFSGKAFMLVIGALLAGAFAGSLIPLIGGTIGRVGGIALGGFLFGLLASNRRYLETAIAGAGVGTATVLTGVLNVGVLPVWGDFLANYGIGIAIGGGVLGLLLTVVAFYFGRDLRTGLAKEIP